MPCTFCHSLTHTLRNCIGNISGFIQQFRELVTVNPYALRQQYLFLNKYSKPVLTLICRRTGLNAAGNKFHLAGKIVKMYFERYSNRFDLNIGDNEANIMMDQINNAYDDLQTWMSPSNPELQAWCLEMQQKINIHHTRMFGTSIVLTRFLIQLQANPLPAVNQKAHLQHLQINVTVDTELAVQECFMCCNEDKNLAVLGCSHSYCTDCVINTAVARTKSVIKCAICRENVAEIKVGTEDLRAAITARLAEE